MSMMHSDRKGDCTVTGWADIEDGKLVLRNKTKETGIAGVGTGEVYCALLDENDKKIMDHRIRLSVGADFWDGVATKDQTDEKPIPDGVKPRKIKLKAKAEDSEGIDGINEDVVIGAAIVGVAIGVAYFTGGVATVSVLAGGGIMGEVEWEF